MQKTITQKSCTLAAIALLAMGNQAKSQTLLFETTMGDFEMVLNPTDHPDLGAHIDNIIAYTALGRYNNTLINRAIDGFVLQMGSLTAFPNRTLDLFQPQFTQVETLSPVIVTDGDGNIIIDVEGEPGDDDDLTNTVGTVSLALGNFPDGATDPDSGTSSFFINLDDNLFLDDDGFIPFATVSDLSTIDAIMELPAQDISFFVGQPNSSAFTDFPLTEENDPVVINQVTITELPSGYSVADAIVRGLGIEIPDGPTGSIDLPDDDSGAVGVPEPTALALLVACGLCCATQRRRHGPR